MYEPDPFTNPENLESLGARSMDVSSNTEYVPPKFEERPPDTAKSALSTLFMFVVVPLLVIGGLIGFWVYGNVSTKNALLSQGTEVVDKYFASIVSGHAAEAMGYMCPAEPDLGWSLYQAADEAGIVEAADMFTVSDSTVYPLDPTLSSNYTKPDPTYFDALSNPPFTHWIVVYGVVTATSTGPTPMSFHIGLDDTKSTACIVLIRPMVNDAASLDAIGSVKDFKAANALTEEEAKALKDSQRQASQAPGQ